VFSNGSIVTQNTAAPVSDWQFASAWLSVMADESGSNPRPGKEQPSSSPSPNAPRKSIRPPFNLLLAEDNLPDALLVREAIKMENLPLEVHIAPDGERAIDLIVNAENDPAAPCPHVLLIDINLPRIDGFEVLRRIRASGKFKNIPVLVVTSSDSPADQREAAKLGARYFRKPITYDEFMKIGAFLRRFLEESGML
jgi:two-component system, response regulator